MHITFMYMWYTGKAPATGHMSIYIYMYITWDMQYLDILIDWYIDILISIHVPCLWFIWLIQLNPTFFQFYLIGQGEELLLKAVQVAFFKPETLSCAGEGLYQSWESIGKSGKIIGKSGKIIGTIWEIHRNIWKKMGHISVNGGFVRWENPCKNSGLLWLFFKTATLDGAPREWIPLWPSPWDVL